MHALQRSTSLAIAWAINSLAYSIVYPFIPIYLHSERQIPMSTVGLIFPLMGLANVLTPPLAGWLTDRVGRHAIMQLGQSLRALIFLLLAFMAYCQAPFWLFAMLLMCNAGIGVFFQVAADSYLVDMSSVAERPKIYGKIRIGTNVGWALGPMLGAFLARTPFPLMFTATAALCVLGYVYTGRNCPELARHQPTRNVAEALQPELGSRELLANAALLKLLFFSFLLFLLTSQLYSLLSIYATTVVGISRNVLGLVYSVNGFTVIFFQLPVTRLLGRLNWHLPSQLVGGAALYALGYFSLGFCDSGLKLAVAVFLLTQGEVIVQPSLYTMVSRLVPRSATGRSMATLSLVRGIGYALGPWIGAMLFQKLSSQPVALWGTLSLLAVAAAIGFHSMKKTVLKEE